MARHDLGTVDAEAFAQWRGQSPAHAVAFARAWAAWERLGTMHGAEQGTEQGGEQDTEQADGRIGVVPDTHVSRRRFLRAAAVAGGVVVMGGGLLTSRAYAWSHAETRVGETRMVRLPDGSAMMLNTDSAVAWKFDRDRHVLRVDRGEVSLDVRPGQVRLSLANRAVAALLSPGRFNARLKAGALDIMVLRGSASVAMHGAADGTARTAGPDQTLLMTDAAATVRPVSRRQMASTLAWQNGEILFQDEPLSAAVEEYNRYLSGKITIMDSSLGGIRVGGRFTTTDPSVFLAGLRTSLDIDVQESNGGYLLTRKK